MHCSSDGALQACLSCSKFCHFAFQIAGLQVPIVSEARLTSLHQSLNVFLHNGMLLNDMLLKSAALHSKQYTAPSASILCCMPPCK